MNRHKISIATFLLMAFIIAIPGRVIGSASPTAISDQKQSITRHDDGDWTWMWNQSGRGIEVRIRGRVEFNDDYTDVTDVSSDGMLRIRDWRTGTERKLEIVRDSGGGLKRTYWVEGQLQPFDSEARRWMATVLIEPVRQGGLDAAARVQRIYKQRGADGVLDEITEIRSDHVKRIYFERLMEIGSIDAGTARRILGQVSRELSSDYQKSRILIKVADNYLGDESTRSAYLNAVGTIGSDYEKGRVLAALMKKENLSKQTLVQTLQVGAGISSSHEKAKLLVRAADLFVSDNAMVAAFFDALATIDSNYERRRVLSALLKRSDLSKDTLVRAFKSVGNMSANHEKATILTSAADAHLGDESLIPAYLEAAGTINASYELRRVLSALLKKNSSIEALLQAIKVASSISSDHEKSTVLRQIVSIDSSDRAVHDALVDAARTINSEYERGRVLSAIFKHQGRN